MSSLQQLMNEYTAQQIAAARNPEDYAFTARPGIEMSIRAAKDGMEALEKRYSKAFLTSAVAIFLEGPKAAELAQQFCQSIVAVDAAGLYKRLAIQVDPTVGISRVFGANQAGRALSELRNIGVELHIASFKHVDFGPAVETKTFSDVVSHLRNGIRKALGEDLNRMYVEAEVTRKALAIKFAGASAPVFVLNAQPDEQPGLSAPFGRGSATWVVADDAEMNDEYVNKMIKEVNRRLSPKKK